MNTTGSKKYVIDSWAWIEYLDGSKTGDEVSSKIKSGAEIYTNMISIAEVVSKTDRKGKNVEIAIEAITSLSKVIVGDYHFAMDVGLLHSNIKKDVPNFSLADAFTLQTARSLNAKVLTGDPDFKGIKEAELIK